MHIIWWFDGGISCPTFRDHYFEIQQFIILRQYLAEKTQAKWMIRSKYFSNMNGMIDGDGGGGRGITWLIRRAAATPSWREKTACTSPVCRFLQIDYCNKQTRWGVRCIFALIVIVEQHCLDACSWYVHFASEK